MQPVVHLHHEPLLIASEIVSSAREVKMTGTASAPGVQSRGGDTHTKGVAAIRSLGSAMAQIRGSVLRTRGRGGAPGTLPEGEVSPGHRDS